MNDRARIQRRRNPETGTETSRGRIAVDGVARSGIQPLAGADRDFFAARLGHDFSQVRVHADAEAAESAAAIGARAYTIGSDVVFGDGNYAPEVGDGRRLLAHELTHVAQQGLDVAVPSPEASALTFGEPGDAFEAAADLAADAVLAGESASLTMAPSPAFGQAAPAAQLDPEDDQAAYLASLPEDGMSIDTSLPPPPSMDGGGFVAGAEGSGGGPTTGPMGGGGTTLDDVYGVATDNVLGAGMAFAENTESLKTVAQLGGQSPLGAALAPVGLYSGIEGASAAWDRPLAENDYLGSGLQKGGDFTANSMAAGAGLIGTTGLAGAGLTAAGATGLGGAMTSTAAALGPAGAVLAAGAGGYELGTLLAENTAAGKWSTSAVGAFDHLITGEGERSSLLRASEWLEDL